MDADGRRWMPTREKPTLSTEKNETLLWYCCPETRKRPCVSKERSASMSSLSCRVVPSHKMQPSLFHAAHTHTHTHTKQTKMNPILTIEPSLASELLSRQRNHCKEQLPALTRVTERERQAKSEGATTTATKKTRHQRYVSESYFAHDDLTDATVESGLSWYFDSLANVGSERSLHSNRVRHLYSQRRRD